jgi:hypothetical protein
MAAANGRRLGWAMQVTLIAPFEVVGTLATWRLLGGLQCWLTDLFRRQASAPTSNDNHSLYRMSIKPLNFIDFLEAKPKEG